MPTKAGPEGALRRVVVAVALFNLLYFGVEFSVAKLIGSVSLFADSVDFLEDASVNALIALALAWPPRWRARVGMLLSAILLLPAIAFLWTALRKLRFPKPPEPWAMSVTGAGALLVNLGCALLLAKFRHHAGSLTRAAFLSARNDVGANLAIAAAGALTRWLNSIWPDLIVGLGIAAMNLDAAREVWEAARGEHEAQP